MRRPMRRTRVRAALDAASIPVFVGPRVAAASAEAIRFVRAPGWMPRRRRAYVIGDIHGRRDSLPALHQMIADDLAARPTGSAVLVHLGDYVGPGADSAGVVGMLCTGPGLVGVQVV